MLTASVPQKNRAAHTNKYERCTLSHVLPYVIEHHYLHRRPPCTYAFRINDGGRIVGVVTFGTPPSRHLQQSLCPSAPNNVLELNRLWIHDDQPKNTASQFVAWALSQLPPKIIVSYADTAYGHEGYVYRALNFWYAGMTDADRKTPRYDYVVPGKHSRDAFRGQQEYTRIRRRPKHRYWTVTGTRRERRALKALANWPCLSWKEP